MPVGVNIPAMSTVRRTIEVVVLWATFGNCTSGCVRCANSCGVPPLESGSANQSRRFPSTRVLPPQGTLISHFLAGSSRSGCARAGIPTFSRVVSWVWAAVGAPSSATRAGDLADQQISIPPFSSQPQHPVLALEQKLPEV